MANPYVNRVDVNGQTIIDLTSDTVTAGDLLTGVTAHDRSGAAVTGTLDDFTGATSSAAGAHGLVPAPSAGDEGKFLSGGGTWEDVQKPIVVLSYGSSTWNDFISAYNSNAIVFCRASSNTNPATGTQIRMGVLMTVDDPSSPTEAKFQYYHRLNPHSSTQLCDDVLVYTLNSSGNWSVSKRLVMSKIVAGTGMSSSYDNETLTLTATGAVSSVNGQTGAVTVTVPTNVSDLTNDSGFLTSSTGVTSVNGSTGAVTVTVPTKVSDLTNDSGFLTSSTGVTSVNGSTGAVTVTVPTKVSDLTNDSGFITSSSLPGDMTGASANAAGTHGLVPAPSSGEQGYFLRGDGDWVAAPVTSVNGSTGAVTLSIPDATSDLTNDSGFITSSDLPTKVSDLTNDSGFLTSSTGVTTFNGSSGAITYTAPVTSVNGSTGAVTLSIPSATSDLTNDSGFITDAGVTSFNGSTGAITYTAPVTSVNGSTGAVTLSIPSATSDLTNDSGFITDAGVTSFNGSTGAITYTAPVTSVNGNTGAVSLSIPSATSDLTNDSGFLTSSGAVTSFNGSTGAVTYTAPVTSVNGSTGAVTVTPGVSSDVLDETILTSYWTLNSTSGNYEYTLTPFSTATVNDEVYLRYCNATTSVMSAPLVITPQSGSILFETASLPTASVVVQGRVFHF